MSNPGITVDVGAAGCALIAVDESGTEVGTYGIEGIRSGWMYSFSQWINGLLESVGDDRRAVVVKDKGKRPVGEAIQVGTCPWLIHKVWLAHQPLIAIARVINEQIAAGSKSAHPGAIQVRHDGRCDCDAASDCPLGRTSMERRCTIACKRCGKTPLTLINCDGKSGVCQDCKQKYVNSLAGWRIYGDDHTESFEVDPGKDEMDKIEPRVRAFGETVAKACSVLQSYRDEDGESVFEPASDRFSAEGGVLKCRGRAGQFGTGMAASMVSALAEWINDVWADEPRDVRGADGPTVAPAPASERQVGGSHYKDLPLQPGFYEATNYGPHFFCGSANKRIASYRATGDKEELEKTIHELQLILEWIPNWKPGTSPEDWL